MIIPHTSLREDVLRAVVEEFVSREGTDYGFAVSIDSKISTVVKQLESGKAVVMFDVESETCDIVSVGSARYKELIEQGG